MFIVSGKWYYFGASRLASHQFWSASHLMAGMELEWNWKWIPFVWSTGSSKVEAEAGSGLAVEFPGFFLGWGEAGSFLGRGVK